MFDDSHEYAMLSALTISFVCVATCPGKMGVVTEANEPVNPTISDSIGDESPIVVDTEPVELVAVIVTVRTFPASAVTGVYDTSFG